MTKAWLGAFFGEFLVLTWFHRPTLACLGTREREREVERVDRGTCRSGKLEIRGRHRDFARGCESVSRAVWSMRHCEDFRERANDKQSYLCARAFLFLPALYYRSKFADDQSVTRPRGRREGDGQRSESCEGQKTTMFLSYPTIRVLIYRGWWRRGEGSKKQNILSDNSLSRSSNVNLAWHTSRLDISLKMSRN